MNPAISLREVQEYLGHANAATTSERYAHFMPKTDAAERMEDSFSSPEAVPVEGVTR